MDTAHIREGIRKMRFSTTLDRWDSGGSGGSGCSGDSALNHAGEASSQVKYTVTGTPSPGHHRDTPTFFDD